MSPSTTQHLSIESYNSQSIRNELNGIGGIGILNGKSHAKAISFYLLINLSQKEPF